ncbi:hypothetical protein AXF42_Ash006098 [Apostasia shenzhenica]|uniref:Glycosyltransferase family 92 protein n=1 Tax=Apostasia shenzhenica TaxID=1088818 RepID=A0A2I0B072_9ASPA|nr:hypothetical protein AXF42_Ash006098 [Apostasia shenzhenica]
MAGLNAPLRSSVSSSYAHSSLVWRLLLLLTVLPLVLAVFAFFLQWRGGLDDPASRWPAEEKGFPGMGHSPLSLGGSSPSAMSLLSPSSGDCAEILVGSSSPSFPYYRGWKFDFEAEARPKGVKLIYRTPELEEKQAKSRIWNETWLAGFFYKPCNYELFVKQSLNMEMAIIMAQDAGMEWIIHLDTDELIHPAGAREYSLTRLLADIPGNVDMVSMFKKNYDHLPKDTYFGMYKEATRGNPNYFLTYGNGKSAARVQNNLRPNGLRESGVFSSTIASAKTMNSSALSSSDESNTKATISGSWDDRSRGFQRKILEISEITEPAAKFGSSGKTGRTRRRAIRSGFAIFSDEASSFASSWTVDVIRGH